MTDATSLRPTAAQPRAAAPTVADDIAATLRNYGVRFAFGIPGNDVLELVRAFGDCGIEFVLAKSEPAAAFMADAVYQATGAPAVLICALGPGLSNAMSGIAGAWQERSAVIVFAGNIAARLHGIYSHQVFDHLAMATPVTKLAARLNPERAAQQTARALDVALAHPAGPVLLDCPADATRLPGGPAGAPHAPPRVLDSALQDAALEQARAMIAQSRKPLLLIGREALHARVVEPLRAFAASRALPFLSTYKAKGVIPETSPHCLGSLGLSPVVDAEILKLLAESDLLLLAGFDPIELRDAWLDAWPGDKPVLSIDWVAQTHRTFPVGTQAIGDMPTLLAQLTTTGAPETWRDAAGKLAAFRKQIAHITRPRDPRDAISPAGLFSVVSGQLRDDWILTVDVGAHRILANHAIACRSAGQMLQSNGLGCMGYALPAAIGAQLAHPERPVVALIGDGCLLMTIGELAVAKERNLPIVVVVLNDSTLALIKLKQSKMQMAGQGVDFGAQRFDLIAQGFGAKGVRVTDLAAFSAAFAQAVSERGLTVIDAVVDPSEYWEQM